MITSCLLVTVTINVSSHLVRLAPAACWRDPKPPHRRWQQWSKFRLHFLTWHNCVLGGKGKGNQHESTSLPTSREVSIILEKALKLLLRRWHDLPNRLPHTELRGQIDRVSLTGMKKKKIWKKKCLWSSTKATEKPARKLTHLFDSLAPFELCCVCERSLRIYNIILLCRLMCGILKHTQLSISQPFLWLQNFFSSIAVILLRGEREGRKKSFYVDKRKRDPFASSRFCDFFSLTSNSNRTN